MRVNNKRVESSFAIENFPIIFGNISSVSAYRVLIPKVDTTFQSLHLLYDFLKSEKLLNYKLSFKAEIIFSKIFERNYKLVTFMEYNVSDLQMT